MEENKRDAECVRIDTSTERSMVGKLVVVTGASSGIGRAIAKVFYSQGACVALGARRMELLQSLCQDLENPSVESPRALPVQTDVTNRASVVHLVSEAEKTFGRGVDVLVNVAGVMYFTMMKNVKEEEWEQTVDVNCKGVLNGFGAVLPSMVERGKGHIITISSDAQDGVYFQN